jgi:Tol biopolymer transport system component
VTQTNSAWRRSLLVAWVAAALVVACSGVMLGEQMQTQAARFVARQRISGDAAATLRAPALGGDGRLIAFVARARDASESRCCLDVYVLDTSTGVITQESINPDDRPPRGDSQSPTLSWDGRIVAFETMASNLHPDNVRPTGLHIIVRERQDGVLRTPVSVSGGAPNGATSEPAVSGNGGAVAFTSAATNLVSAEDANGQQTDIYLWRLDTDNVIRVSVDSQGTQPALGASHSPRVSHDGGLVAFVSTARLVPEDTNKDPDVYLRDVRQGRTVLVSRGVNGRSADGASGWPALSADGRHVAFVSMAGNLTPRDRNHENDIYVYDVAAGTAALISATSKGEAANAGSGRPALSADGRYVVYQSVASNLGSGPGCPQVASDKNLLPDVYVFDRAVACVTRISGSPAQEWWTPSVAPAIDGSGRRIVFSSTQPANDDDLTTDFDLFKNSVPDQRAVPVHEEPAS